MKRTAAVALALSLLAVQSAAVRAQTSFGVAAGPSIPQGDFSTIATTGYHITGMAIVAVPLAPVGFRFEGTYSEFAHKAAFNSAVKVRALYATANGTYTLSGLSAPYVIAGLGLYDFSAQCSGCTASNTRIGFNGGVGYKLGLSGLSVFLEARMHYIAGPSDPTNGGVAGSNTRFIPISVGVTF